MLYLPFTACEFIFEGPIARAISAALGNFNWSNLVSLKFTLLILDPKDGGVMYQTEDASQPWNGIDKRTGQLSPSNQAYIWKVRISNPLPGESPEYKGTITKL